MPTIYTSNPSEFRARMDATYEQMEARFREIVAERESTGTHVCTSCGTSARIADMRRGADSAVLCPACLEGMSFCQLSNVYHPAALVQTYFDAASAAERSRPTQFSSAALAAQGREVFECPHCHDHFFGRGIKLRKADGTTVTICGHCARNFSFRCDSCAMVYEVEAQRDNCCGDRSHCQHKDVTMVIDEGSSFARFSNRPVGMEIETGSGGRKLSVYRWLNRELPSWGAVSDGSLPSDGYEYVSNPTTGNKIGDNYKGFISAMLAQEVEIEHQRAGYHVHINAKDLFGHIEGLSRTNPDKADRAEIMLQDWGKAMVEFSKEMVAPWRRGNHFCNGEFGYRSSKGNHPRFLRRATGSNYPAIAIRMETLEFRLFPSTGNQEWHLTRTEVAQKAVDFLYKCVIADDRPLFNAFLAVLRDARCAEKVTKVVEMLGISEVSAGHLAKIHKTWSPAGYSDGKAVGSEYRKEPRPRKKRSDAGVARGPRTQAIPAA